MKELPQLQAWCTPDRWKVSVWKNKPKNSGCVSAGTPKCVWPGFFCAMCNVKVASLKWKRLAGPNTNLVLQRVIFFFFFIPLRVLPNVGKVLETNWFRLRIIHRWRWRNPSELVPHRQIFMWKRKDFQVNLRNTFVITFPLSKSQLYNTRCCAVDCEKFGGIHTEVTDPIERRGKIHFVPRHPLWDVWYACGGGGGPRTGSQFLHSAL